VERVQARNFLGGTPVREAMLIWAGTLLGLGVIEVAALGVPFLGQVVGALAVAAFLWVPQRMLERRGLEARDAGLTLEQWPRDLLHALALALIVLPLFVLAYLNLSALQPLLPDFAAGLAAPFAAPARFVFRLPPAKTQLELLGQLGGHAAVALSEEFFYRGYLTSLFETAWPPRQRIAGAAMGRGALVAAALFALGHLLVPAPFRLLTFFPALIFAWLRARTGTIAGAAIFHFLCNATLLILQHTVVAG
jgi:membrane protease YdiL (CAAX protease family)